MGLDFPSLPADVSVMLLETLPGRDILACGATCRRLRSLVTDSVSLQYAIELFACGMLDGPRGPQSLSIPDRLDRLRRFTAAWEQLQWTNRVMLSHFVGFRPCYDLSGDMLALTRADGLDLMVSRQFSSELRGIDEHHIVFAVPGSSRLSNFQVSLDQDLLFFKELLPGNSLRLHSRSLLTGETHPLAYISDVTNAAAYIHDICGDFLLETSYLDGPALSQLRLRNLKTGLVSKNGMPQDHKRAIFLDKHHILSVGPHIWGLANLSCLYVSSLVHDYPTPPSYAFSLPDFLQGAVARPQAHEMPTPRGCFYPDPADRLITIALSRQGQNESLTLDLLASTLTRYIETHPPSAGERVVVVPWDVWGPHGTRMTTGGSGFVAQRSVFGARRILVHRLSDSDGTKMLTVLDYAPRRVARAIIARGSAHVLHGAEVGAVHTGGHIGVLRTLLPCIATTIPFPVGAGDMHVNASICESGVLFIKLDEGFDKIVEAWACTI